MCGIAGLFVKDPSLEAELGALLVPMLEALAERGPDSTGVGLYSPAGAGTWKISLRSKRPGFDWTSLVAPVDNAGAGRLVVSWSVDHGAVVLVEADDPAPALRVLRHADAIDVLGYGRAVEIVKGVGPADEVCGQYGISARSGHHGLGHTRMATESAVTAVHCHPFSPVADLCVVHNGSFSNHCSVRRQLQAEGVIFDSDNDSEVAARLIGTRLACGDDLAESLRWVQKELDGFFTLLVTSADEFAVVRDPFACKPAAVAETDRYVAVASEYRALAALPGIDAAKVFEPEPGEIYAWSH